MADNTMYEIIELQARLAFQDATIEELDQVVTQHSAALAAVTLELKRLRELVSGLSEATAENAVQPERPPHY